MRRLEMTLVHPAGERLDFVDNIVVSGTHAWALGGFYYPRITCLASSDGGRSFAKFEGPTEGGLLDGHAEDGTLWVVGANAIASTPFGDGVEPAWTVHGRDATLYALVRDPRGFLWAMGDRGTLLRSTRKRDRWRKVPNASTSTILNLLAERDATWVIDNGGRLQRATGKGKFETLAVSAMRKDRPLCAMARTPRGTLLLVGDLGMVLRSTDDAKTWKKIPIDSGADVEDLVVTRYGIFLVADHGSILVSYDDGKSFEGFESILEGHVWCMVECGDGFLIGGDAGRVWRVERTELAGHLRDGIATSDPELAALAGRVHDGDEGADLVFEDALREREQW